MVLTVIIVSYRRGSALRATLLQLAQQGVPGLLGGSSIHTEIIVVDNASGDDSVAMLRREFPGVGVIELPDNAGVQAFNVGAKAARGEVLLILDDDAWPDAGVLGRAIGAMQADPGLGAVALLPVHPATRVSEWPFVRTPLDRFPFMGCANLIRREAWERAGGYESGYFLYRNDTDLALTLHGLGLNVRCDPGWRAWHDSPAAAAKSERWLHLATRNWLWLCRRHARGRAAVFGALGGIARAVVHAGASPRRLACVLRGVWAGFFSPAPVSALANPGAGFRRLLHLRRVRGA